MGSIGQHHVQRQGGKIEQLPIFNFVPERGSACEQYLPAADHRDMVAGEQRRLRPSIEEVVASADPLHKQSRAGE